MEIIFILFIIKFFFSFGEGMELECDRDFYPTRLTNRKNYRYYGFVNSQACRGIYEISGPVIDIPRKCTGRNNGRDKTAGIYFHTKESLVPQAKLLFCSTRTSGEMISVVQDWTGKTVAFIEGDFVDVGIQLSNPKKDPEGRLFIVIAVLHENREITCARYKCRVICYDENMNHIRSLVYAYDRQLFVENMIRYEVIGQKFNHDVTCIVSFMYTIMETCQFSSITSEVFSLRTSR
ncbi:hypothetical protein SNEBB_007288 [Seison nebaliae]|nr:hypothetical protein SNEBB_007288 [Seison nebaliae]